MIIRTWRARVSPGRDDDLARFISARSAPVLGTRPGCLGALFTRDGEYSVVITLWRDRGAIEALKGDPEYLQLTSAIATSGILDGDATTTLSEAHSSSFGVTQHEGRAPESTGEAARNKALLVDLLSRSDGGHIDSLGASYAADYVDHRPSAVRSGGNGRAGIEATFASVYRAFPDTVHVVEDIIAEGDRVAVRIYSRGTHTGELMGIPPTGRAFEMRNIAIYRFAEGRIVERWAYHGLDLVEQIRAALPDLPT